MKRGLGMTETRGVIGAILSASLRLGLTSFGGPVAHIGYFEHAYVAQRAWLTRGDFAGLVALCQMVPGPASSQLGWLIGLMRGRWAGGLAAWAGFTLPSALLMFAYAQIAGRIAGPVGIAALHGLKLVAVAVVAQAVWSMARSHCPDWQRRMIALAALALALTVRGPVGQLAVLCAGALLGGALCQTTASAQSPPVLPVSRRVGLAAGGVFVALLAAAEISTPGHTLWGLAALFYRSGALVFGGGHVVLPLLRGSLVPAGWLNDQAFLAGYGAAQALPGPLFAFAAYLGAAAAPHAGGLTVAALWSGVALVSIFLPGLLVALCGAALWNWLGHHAHARAGLAGINAGVVGLLGAALYDPVWTSAVLVPRDAGVAIVALGLLEIKRWPPVAVVAATVIASVLLR